MNFNLIKTGLKNNNQEIIEEIINTIIEEDYNSLKKLYIFLKNKANKEVLHRYIDIILSNIEPIYDDKMNLNNKILFLKSEEKYIIKHLISRGHKLTKKELFLINNEILSYIDLDSSYPEIISRIKANTFDFSNLGSRKLEEITKLIINNEDNMIYDLIDNYNYIVEYNKSNMNSNILLSNTLNNDFREKILLSSKFNKDLYKDPHNIAKYLSKKEVEYLKTDQNISNLFLSKGVRFDIIDKITTKNLLENLDSFKVFPFITIYEFSESYKDKESLLENDIFMDIFLSRIDDIYDKSSLLYLLDSNTLTSILRKDLSKIAILYIMISIKKELLIELLKDKYYYDILYNTNNKKIYKYLDKPITLDILSKKEKLLTNYTNIVLSLNKKDISKLPVDNLFKEYKQLLKEDKLSKEVLDKIAKLFNFKIEHNKVKKTKIIIKEPIITKHKEITKMYNNLKEKNIYLDNTLESTFLDDNTINIKYNYLEYISKHPDIQNYIKNIMTVLNYKDINYLINALDKLDIDYYLPRILILLEDNIAKTNCKKMGNIIKVLNKVEDRDQKLWNKTINYLLYYIPIIPDVIKSNFIPKPRTIDELINYENKILLVPDETFKHFKLTKEEVYYLTNTYSKNNSLINRINNLNNMVNEPIYSIKDTYIKLEEINKKISDNYNHLIKDTNNNNNKIVNKINRKEIITYYSKPKYNYLLLDTKDKDTYDKYIDYLNNIPNNIELTYINKYIDITDGIYYGYTNIEKNSLKDIKDNKLFISKYTNTYPNPYYLPDILVIIAKDDSISLLDEALNIKNTFNKELKIIILNTDSIAKTK